MNKFRFIAAVIGVVSIIMTVLVSWISQTFGDNIYFEQIVWHLQESPIGGIDKSYIQHAFYCILYITLLGIAWIIILYPRKIINRLRRVAVFRKVSSQQPSMSHAYVMALFCISSVYFVVICIFWNQRFHISEYVVTEIHKIFHDDRDKQVNDELHAEYSVPARKDISFEKKRSIVIVLAESMETSFNDPRLEEPLMPNMKSLQSVSQYAHNFVPVYGTGWTMASVTGWFFGLPLRLPNGIDGNRYISKKGFLPGAESIFDILKDNGYELVLILGSDSRFSGQNILFSGHCGFTILDKEYFIRHGWSVEEYQGTGWGFSDAFIFERALEELKKLQAAGKPFVLFIETIDTHSPEGFCPPERRKYGDIRDAIRELDRNLAEFSQEIWNDDLIYIVLGDHFFMGSPDFLSRLDERRLFNLFHGDVSEIPAQKKDGRVSALDMAPTLLQAAGARWQDDQFGLGVSLFSGRPSLLEQYGASKFNGILSGWSPFYSTLYERKADE